MPPRTVFKPFAAPTMPKIAFAILSNQGASSSMPSTKSLNAFAMSPHSIWPMALASISPRPAISLPAVRPAFFQSTVLKNLLTLLATKVPIWLHLTALTRPYRPRIPALSRSAKNDPKLMSDSLMRLIARLILVAIPLPKLSNRALRINVPAMSIAASSPSEMVSPSRPQS